MSIKPRYQFLCFFIILSSGSLFGQNHFRDPSFDEPIPLKKTITQCGGNTGETFDANSNVYQRIGDGSPDIVVPINEFCRRRVDNALITSKCLGMIFSNTKNSLNPKYKESVQTKLNRPLRKGGTYEIRFDALFNTNLYFDQMEVVPHQTRHFNVVLKSSTSAITDTLVVPVSSKAYKSWQQSELVFKSKSAFDIVQFDFFSDLLFAAEQEAFINIYLDNFSLVSTNKAPTLFLELSPERVFKFESKVLSYYFDSDSYELSQIEVARLKKEIKRLSLQNIHSIEIQAYTDRTNTRAYNLALSEKRAQGIDNTLQELLGSDSISFSVVGKGIDLQKEGEKARRVDVKIRYKKDEVAPWYQTHVNKQYSINYSFLGNTELCKLKSGVPDSKQLQENDPEIFDNIPFDAQKLILSKAKKTKILIINEAHTSPNHRAFISSLLPQLNDLGYGKLAVEALQVDNEPHSLTIKDPVFFRYLLDAQKQGYDLLSYDSKTNKEPNWEDIEEVKGVEYMEGFENISKDMNTRDYNQFLNLKDGIDALSEDEKIIIHVGLGHSSKIQKGDWKPLGSYLCDMYGSSSVLSIDQETLNNCISIDSNQYCIMYQPTKSIVCSVDKVPYTEKEFNPLKMSFSTFYDLQILHPEMDPILKRDTSFIYVNHMDIEDATYPLAIMIYEPEADPRTDVGYSAIEVRDIEDWRPSIIPNEGGFWVLVKDAENEVLVYEEF